MHTNTNVEPLGRRVALSNAERSADAARQPNVVNLAKRHASFDDEPFRDPVRDGGRDGGADRDGKLLCGRLDGELERRACDIHFGRLPRRASPRRNAVARAER